MSPGELILKLAFVAVIASVALFITSLRGKRAATAGVWAFRIHAVLVVTAMGMLAYYFVAHHFEYEYVSNYSSRSLSPALTVASSWAGQEGSVLLWAMFGALVGVALLRQPGSLTYAAMFFVSLMQFFLMLLLMVRSPFRLLPVVPADGKGLNPLLEDPWMVIHPPVLFLGYAAMVVPFAIAAAALVRKEYQDWDRTAWPWSLFAVLALGTGIVLGGIWAFAVLGWGGYWGWDPVENASLIPWILALALVHGLLIQRTTGAGVRTNLILAMIGWVTVVGGTYLTRSGVLQDFSVHSFTDMGLNTPLLAFLGTSFAITAGLMIVRWKSIQAPTSNWMSANRESGLWLGMMTLIVLAILVTVGTTAPITTTLMGEAANVNQGFYNTIIIPFGFLMLLLLAITPALRTTRQEKSEWAMTLAPGVLLGLAALVGTYLAGLRDITHLLLAALSGLALGVSSWATIQRLRKGWEHAAGALGHAGVTIMTLGIVVSGSMSENQQVQLPQGTAMPALGYSLTLQGTELGRRGEQILLIEIADEDWHFDARPWMLPMGEDRGMMRTPSISGWRGLYLSPVDYGMTHNHEEGAAWLEKGKPVTVGDVSYTFTAFRMESHDQQFHIFADIQVERDGESFQISPSKTVGGGQEHSEPAEVPGVGMLTLGRVDADNGRVAVELPGAEEHHEDVLTAVVELSTKPLIHLVWIGAVLTMLAALVAGVRRARERALKVPATAMAAPGQGGKGYRRKR
jgi:cytochrome c-type biogenesis protein CcmF